MRTKPCLTCDDVKKILAAAEASAPPSARALRAYHWALCAFVVALLFAIPSLIVPIK